MNLLEIDGISKTFDNIPIIRNISFSLKAGANLCLLGPSGCGKTTLLKIIAGLEKPDCGKIIFNGRNMSGAPAHKRRFRMMFQEFALFPHKNVFDNIAFGLKIQKLSKNEIKQRVEQMLDMTGLSGFEKRNINNLSGGERQRVALARSLAPQTELLLLDEPFGALDSALRKKLILDINKILKRVRVPTILVTHDQTEAFAIADKIAVMHNGKILQIDSPENIYKQPANRTIAEFLGFSNFIKGYVEESRTVKTALGTFFLDQNIRPGDDITILFLPQSAELTSDTSKNKNIISGKIEYRLFQGSHYQIGVQTQCQTFFFNIFNRQTPPQIGENISLSIDKAGIIVMQPDVD